ncbi:MAG: FAD:protein FMN transferase [Planctomycetota bacterium]
MCIRVYPWIVLAALIAWAEDTNTRVYVTESDALHEAFTDATAFASEAYRPSEEERARIEARSGRPLHEDEFRIHSAWSGGTFLGYAVITEEIGCFKPITFLVATDPSGAVLQVSILVYRECRGGEIARLRFRKQLLGKTLSDPIRQNHDIVNITGATTSVKSITDGVRKVLAAIDSAYLSANRRPSPPGAVAVAVSEDRGTVRRARQAMGSLLEITALDALPSDVDAAFREVARLEKVLSHYRADSELSLALRVARTGPARLGDDLFECLMAARRAWEASGGVFDPTVAPLVEAWGFKGGGGRVPTEAELKAALARVGFGHVTLDPDRRTMALDRPDVSLDLGAIGKGYAVDRAAAMLRARGVKVALVDFTGNMYAMGAPPGEEGWPVLLRHPRNPESSLGVVFLKDRAISTSGDYEKCVVIDGKRYHHILDPRTGRPSETACQSTVLAATATEADALSTTICVLGPDRGREAAMSSGVEALIVAEPVPGGDLRCVGTPKILSELHVDADCGAVEGAEG